MPFKVKSIGKRKMIINTQKTIVKLTKLIKAENRIRKKLKLVYLEE